ncbi:IS21 family transposase [Paracoccus jiaweipingae]
MKSDQRRLIELLFQEHETNSAIARKLGRHRDTIRKMRTRLALSGLTEEQTAALSDAEINAALGTSRRKRRGFYVPDYDALIAELGKPGKKKRHLYAQYLTQVESDPNTELRPICRTKFHDELRAHQKARGLEYRHVYFAGKIMQADFIGKRPYYVDRDGRKISVEVAVSVLPYSNFTFAIAVRSQGLKDSVTVLAETLEYFQAVPKDAIFDNFKAAVTTPKTENRPAVINRHFKAALDHYSLYPDPTYVAQPRHKGAVENAVKIVTTEFVGSERFLGCSSLHDMNLRLREVIEELNNRPMPTYQRRSRRQIFEAEEHPAMRPLPAEKYRYGEWKEGITVPLHYHIRVGMTEYSVPHRLAGQKVNIKVASDTVEVYASGIVMAVHALAPPDIRRVTLPEHLPDNHLAMRGHDNESVLERARRLGSVVHQFVTRHLEEHANGKAALDMCRQFEKKIRHYGSAAFAAALHEAMNRGQINASAVYTLLERPSQAKHADDLPTSPRPSGNVRGSGYYDDGEDA